MAVSVGSVAQRWWIALLGVVVALAAAAYFTARQQSLYQASASMVVVPNTEIEEATDLIRSLETLERRTIVATFARIPLAPETRDQAARDLGIDTAILRDYQIASSVQPYTNIVRIDVTGPDRELVARLANAAARATRDAARSMYRIYSMKPLARALPAYRPISPDPLRNYLVAAAIGLVVGVLGAAALTYRVRRGEE